MQPILILIAITLIALLAFMHYGTKSRGATTSSLKHSSAYSFERALTYMRQKAPLPSARLFENGRIVRTFTNNGKRVRTIVVGHSKRGYQLQALGHPGGGTFRRKLVTAA